jgi:hypothetical protein
MPKIMRSNQSSNQGGILVPAKPEPRVESYEQIHRLVFHAIIGGCKNEGKSVSERRARLGTGDEGDCAHDDTACVRMMTESGIMLWRDQLVGVISSKSLGECHARNLRPETCRWWLSGCLRKHLFFVRPQHGGIIISSHFQSAAAVEALNDRTSVRH